MNLRKMDREMVETFWLRNFEVLDEGNRYEITRVTKSEDLNSGQTSWSFHGYKLRSDGQRRSNASLVTSEIYLSMEVEAQVAQEVNQFSKAMQ